MKTQNTTQPAASSVPAPADIPHRMCTCGQAFDARGVCPVCHVEDEYRPELDALENAPADSDTCTGEATKETPVKVVFRKWHGGDVIALFPQIPQDVYGHYCVSYERVGQHGGANYDIVSQTSPASPDEYADLKTELERIGYALAVAQKATAKDHQIRRDAARTPTSPSWLPAPVGVSGQSLES